MWSTKKLILGYENNWHNPFVHISGRLGVLLFFVLSGFLITYLLLAEKKYTGSISVRKFYVRRALRIWPLYYLIVILGLFILPEISALKMPEYTIEVKDNFLSKFYLFLFMLPNLALVMFSPVPYLSQSWSIGVEEQFYLIWPNIIKKSKGVLRLLLGVIIIYWVIRLGIMLLQYLFLSTNLTLKYILNFLASFNIDCMAIGGLGAYSYFHKKKAVLNFLYRKDTQSLAIIGTLFFLLLGVKIPYPVYAILFAILILNAATNPKNLLTMENPLFNYLGKISYGLYMYHSLAIAIVLVSIRQTSLFNDFFIYTFSLAISILFASISYFLIEERFLHLKKRFSTILSGELAKNSER